MSPSSLPNPDSFDEPYFFFSTNEQTEILYISPSVEKILGYSPDEMIGRSYGDFLNKCHTIESQDQPLMDQANSEETREFVSTVKSASGTIKIVKVQTYAEPSSEGGHVRCGIAQDITETSLATGELMNRWRELKEAEEKLSARESDVLNKVLSGRLNKSIARELSITERAIERIRSRLKNKFQAENVAELVAKATELRMLNEIVRLERQPTWQVPLPHVNCDLVS